MIGISVSDVMNLLSSVSGGLIGVIGSVLITNHNSSKQIKENNNQLYKQIKNERKNSLDIELYLESHKLINKIISNMIQMQNFVRDHQQSINEYSMYYVDPNNKTKNSIIKQKKKQIFNEIRNQLNMISIQKSLIAQSINLVKEAGYFNYNLNDDEINYIFTLLNDEEVRWNKYDKNKQEKVPLGIVFMPLYTLMDSIDDNIKLINYFINNPPINSSYSSKKRLQELSNFYTKYDKFIKGIINQFKKIKKDNYNEYINI